MVKRTYKKRSYKTTRRATKPKAARRSSRAKPSKRQKKLFSSKQLSTYVQMVREKREGNDNNSEE